MPVGSRRRSRSGSRCSAAPRARVGAGLARRPGERVHTGAEGEAHQLVTPRMEVDPVDAVAEAVVRSQLGTVLIGEARELLRVRRLPACAPRPGGTLTGPRGRTFPRSMRADDRPLKAFHPVAGFAWLDDRMGCRGESRSLSCRSSSGGPGGARSSADHVGQAGIRDVVRISALGERIVTPRDPRVPAGQPTPP